MSEFLFDLILFDLTHWFNFIMLILIPININLGDLLLVAL